MLGLSVTILLSASFAQPAVKRIATTDTKVQQDKQTLNPKIAAKLGLHAFKKHAPAPFQVRKSALKHVATYASQDPEKAKIKLIVGDCWEDGSGYQLLLDSDARLCDGLEEEGFDQSQIDDYYAMADVKLPANASPVIGITSVQDFESDSIEITPGVYDVLVVNPSESEDEDIYVYIAGGTSILDDFEFVKGYAYVFEIELVEDYGDYYDNCIFHTPFELAATFNPVLSCEVGTEADIKLTVTNNGNVDVENFEIWYYVADEADADFEPDVVKQTVAAKLEAGKTETYTFTAKVENIREDSLYVIHAGVTPLVGEFNTENNEVAGNFMKQDGLTELPYEFDLDAYGFIPAASGVWEIEDGVAEASETGIPLISRCFDLKGGSIYRLSYEYMAGFDFWGLFQLSEDYHIGFGLASEPLAEWEVVLEEEEVFATDWEKNEIVLRPQTDGTYAVYFSVDYLGFMSLQNISVSEVMEKDVRLSAFDAGFARLMPMKQANGTFAAIATVENRGSQTIAKAMVEVKMNGTTIGSAEVENMDFGALVDVNIPLTISGLKTGDKAAFEATVTLEGEAEAERKDNTLDWEMEVNDYVMAYDHVMDDMYVIDNAIGIDGYSDVGFGLVFSLNAKDTLTAISLGWCDYDDMSIGIRVQKWDKETKTLGGMVYETEVSRGADAGQREYKVPSIILEAGDYMISMIELSASASGIIVDGDPDGGFYLIVENEAEYVAEVGMPAIRAVFGPDAHPMAKDVVVKEITKPAETGVFVANQEVKAVVENQGYEAVDAPLYLMVNGKVVALKRVSIGKYGNAEVNFVADLSEPGTEYVLTVFSALEGDEDPTNDTCVKIVRSNSVDNEGAARQEARLSVYPNPAREMITFHAQDAVINQVVILNMAGRIVSQSNGLNLTDYRYRVKGLDAGMYFARVKTTQGTAVVKFIVE